MVAYNLMIPKMGVSLLLLLILVCCLGQQPGYADTTLGMVSPANNSTLAGSSATFSWSAGGTSVTAWWLYVGSTSGGTQYLDTGNLGASVTSRTVSGLPTDGSTVYVQLWYLSGSWKSLSYTYKAASPAAVPAMTSPVAGSTLSGNNAIFNWTANGAAVTAWQLLAGSSVGGGQHYDSNELATSSLNSWAISGLPTDGSTVYVRLRYQIGGVWSYQDYTYKAYSAGGGSTLGMVSPANNSTLAGSSATFSWSAGGTSVTAWWLYVGSTSGGTQYLDTGNLGASVTSRTVSGLPTDGSTVYVQLWYLSGSWKSLSYTYKAASPAAAPAMTSPAAGSTLSGSSATFNWGGNGASVTAWQLLVGSSAGGSNYQDSGQLASTVTSRTVSGLPTDGSTVYVRLRYQIGGVWSYQDYTYKAYSAGGGSTLGMVSPANNSTLAGSSATFSWSAGGTSVTAWWLYVGSTLGGTQYLDTGNLGASVTSRTVSGLPTDGSTVYVQLWYLSGSWKSLSYTYKAASPAAAPAMTSPAAGSTLAGSSATFNWGGNGANVTAWQLLAGSSAGGSNYQDSGQLASTVTSRTVSGLPTDGSTVYVRLRYQIGGVWSYQDYTYKAASPAAVPAMTSPAVGSTLSGSSATFNWGGNGASVTAWQLLAGSSAGGSNYQDSGQLASTVTSRTVSGLPTDGSTVYVRLRYQIGGVWSYQDYTYKAYSAGGGSTLGMVSPANNSTLAGSSATFSWSAGGTSVTAWWLYVGSTSGGTQYLDTGNLGASVTSRTVSGLPTDGSTVYVQLWYLSGSWKSLSYTYKAASPAAAPAMTSPAAGSTLSGSSATFNWGGNGANVTAWQLLAGSSAGGSNYQDSGQLASTVTSRTVSGLPTDGSTVYVRLRYQIGGVWSYQDYTYKAYSAGGGSTLGMVSPANNSTLAGSSATFSWSAGGTSVTAWWLYVGSTSGGTQYLDTGNLGASVTSRTVSGLPTDGSTVYVQLWYLSGSWKSLSYTYKAYDANAVVLTDPFLLQCFGGTIPSNSELRALTTFSCDGVDLSSASLAQLGNLPNLRELDLSHTKLADISGLASLTKLISLDLRFNSISNIAALSGMAQLQTLDLGFNAISDATALSNMGSLRELHLDANQVTTLGTALNNKPALTKLYLDDNQLAALPTLPSGLTHLGLGYNRLDSVSGLANLTGLQVLVLDGNRLASLAGLSGKTALQQLYLRGNKSASGVALSDISLLSGLSPTNLTTLELGSNNISDIAPLASLKGLARLGLEGNSLGNAAALSGMARLANLDLACNRLVTTNGLPSLGGLSGQLRLGHNLLLDDDLSALGSMGNSFSLSLEDNCLGSVSLPGQIKVSGEAWQFPAARCGGTAPVATGKTSEIYQDTATSIQLDAYDPNSDPLTFRLESLSVTGGALKTASGAAAAVGALPGNSVRFEPNSGYLGGAGSFTFSVADSNGEKSQVVTVALRVIHPLLDACYGSSIPSEAALAATTSFNCGNQAAGGVPLDVLAHYFPNLDTLILENDGLTDISALTSANFPHLIRLNLSGNPLGVADLTALGDRLPNLIMLFLDNAQLDDADLAALFGPAGSPRLTGLSYLVLRNNSFTGIQPLLRLSNLQVLNLDGNAILDISALSPAAPAALPLPLLSQLSVDGSRLKVASLPRLGSLSYLQASHNCLAAAPDVPASATEVYWGGQRALVSGVCPPYAP